MKKTFRSGILDPKRLCTYLAVHYLPGDTGWMSASHFFYSGALTGIIAA
jgi:hypothetical protein